MAEHKEKSKSPPPQSSPAPSHHLQCTDPLAQDYGYEDDDERSYAAMKRATMVVAARYRSAKRSSSLRREIGVDPSFRSRHTVSDGEVLVMEKMMERDLRHKEVLRRAELMNEQCAAVLQSEELAKEQRNLVRLKEIAQRNEQERQRRSLSINAKMAENSRRRKEIQEQRLAKIQENIRRTDTVRCDPFSYIAMRHRFNSPPESKTTSPKRRGRSTTRAESKESKETGSPRSNSAPYRPRWR